MSRGDYLLLTFNDCCYYTDSEVQSGNPRRQIINHYLINKWLGMSQMCV